MHITLHHINQLPEYRKQVERQRDVLTIATGFSDEDKAGLIAIFDTLLAKADAILALNQTTQPETL